MSEADTIRLRHMLEGAREAISFANGRSKADLATNRMLLLSIMKAIEIIGEAASKVSPDLKRDAPGFLGWISWECETA
jgi:uncharacterized protein with HEPN domain